MDYCGKLLNCPFLFFAQKSVAPAAESSDEDDEDIDFDDDDFEGDFDPSHVFAFLSFLSQQSEDSKSMIFLGGCR